MNLAKLFEVQKVLRDRINYNEPDRFNKLVLALLVELGECANEWRGFKFWSKNQKPKLIQHYHDGTSYYPLLEEYVDGKHFLLELGIEIGYEHYETLEDSTKLETTIDELFLLIFESATQLFFENHKEHLYILLFMLYNQLGEMLGFTWEQIESAYMEKNKVNHQRQDSGVY